jgi:hypothetical protein
VTSSLSLRSLAIAGLLIAGSQGAALADPNVKAVASFSILGDMVAKIGGERVEVTTLVGPDGDAHVYEPTPADAKSVAGANVVIVNGLGFEGWLDRLTQASGYKGPVIVATKGIEPLEMSEEHGHEGEGKSADHDHKEEAKDHDHGGQDPHAWQSLANGLVYVRNIAEGLCTADAQCARPLIHSLNLADLIPLTAQWPGLAVHPNPMYPPGSPPLMHAATTGATPFRLNLHAGDVGHTLVFGPTGAGKSVLLGMIAAQHLRYPGARVTVFDKGRSIYGLATACGAAHYDLAGDETARGLCPLAEIDSDSDAAWAEDYLATLFQLQTGEQPLPR